MHIKIWMDKFNPTLHAQFQQVVALPRPNHAETSAWVRRDCHLTHQTQMQLPYLWSSAGTQADPVLNKKVLHQNCLNTKGHWSQTWSVKKKLNTKDQRPLTKNTEVLTAPPQCFDYGLLCCGSILFSDLLCFAGVGLWSWVLGSPLNPSGLLATPTMTALAMKRAPTKKNMWKPKKTGTGTGKRQNGRVSSKKQIDGTGFPRQKQAALQRAKLVVGKGKFPTCNEVVSGTKPLDQRKVLGTLMSQKNIKIFVENARAIARTAKVGEDIYETAKERGIEIIADDIPNLFALKPRPVETFVRLVTLAVYQLERDLIVERLTKGLALAKKRSKRTTQFGEAKMNGTKSHLEKKAPTKKQMKQLRQVIKKQKRGKISWRQAQADFRSILRKPKLGIDTVRRMIGELELKHFWKGQRVCYWSWRHTTWTMSCFTPWLAACC